MAGRYLATELQDENGDVIYPHTETDIVFGSDGTTVEENLSGEVTDTDMQDVFAGSQPEMNKKLSVKEKIKNALKRYQALLNGKILDTVEEVEANTDDGYLMGAKAGAALINDLGGCSFGKTADGKPGWKDGADTVHPFISSHKINFDLYADASNTAYIKIDVKNYKKAVFNFSDIGQDGRDRITDANGKTIVTLYSSQSKYNIDILASYGDSINIIHPNGTSGTGYNTHTIGDVEIIS